MNFVVRLLLILSLSFSLGMDYVKHVAEPIRQVAPRNVIRGFVDEYGHSMADVLLLAGELHLGRKPVRGSLSNLFAWLLKVVKGRPSFHHDKRPRPVLASRVTSNAAHRQGLGFG